MMTVMVRRMQSVTSPFSRVLSSPVLGMQVVVGEADGITVRGDVGSARERERDEPESADELRRMMCGDCFCKRVDEVSNGSFSSVCDDMVRQTDS
jgi:hypothetical protein